MSAPLTSSNFSNQFPSHQAWAALGNQLRQLPNDEVIAVFSRARLLNPWFTEANCKLALEGVVAMLEHDVLETWLSAYTGFPMLGSKIIGLVLAGNIPMVGFHDLLVCSLAGHKVLVKQSSQDSVLLPWLVSQLAIFDQELASRITFTEQLKGFDGVIATGSNNSARYFDYYFSKVPNIIRKNRHSVAVLAGSETDEELVALGQDVFQYFGHGCRNVSHLCLPAGYDLKHVLDLWHDPYHEVVFHNKYANNYEYNRAMYLINMEQFLDTGYLVLRQNEALHSPLAVVNYSYYETDESLARWLSSHEEDIQCIASNAQLTTRLPVVPLGQTQRPKPWDYADGVDTMAWALSI